MSTRPKKPLSDIDKARQDLARELGARRMRQAMQKIEDARNLLDSGLSDLSTLLGGCKTWQEGGKVSERIRAYWYRVDALRAQLHRKGGAAVDDVHVDAELKRRAAGGAA